MATTYDKASLVMIPSGVKESKLYSIKPTDGSGDFTFSRGTDTATRVNASGLIEKERGNLLLQSNTFDTTWTLNNASVTGGQSGYDGSNDAWELTATSTSSARVQQFESNTGVQSLSIYAKAGTANFILAEKAGTNGFFARFDLSNGTIVNTSGDIDTTIEDVGGGWYRCSVSGNPSASIKSQFYVVDGSSGSAVTNGATIYIQDAQLEQGLVATDYIETTTAAVYEGITDNLPRLDYSGGASCPSLLLEPSRTNVLPQSEYYNASQWTKTRCTISDNTDETLSPEGVYNASKMVSTDASESYAQDEGSITGTLATLSFFAKKGDTDFVHGTIWDNSANGCRQWFNVDSGAVGGNTTFGSGYSVVSGSEKIESFGNGWYRCSFTANVTTGTNAFRMNLSSADETIGSPVNAYGYFYGVQAEAGSYPTSYIPTYGTSASRAQDGLSLTDLQGSGIYPSLSEGTLFFDLEVSGKRDSAGSYRHIRLVDNIDSATNRIRIWEGSAGVISSLRVDFSGTNIEQSFYADTPNKVAVTWGSSGTKIIVNGVVTDTSATQLTFASTPKLLTNVLSNYNFKQVLMFPTALTDAEVISLTTL